MTTQTAPNKSPLVASDAGPPAVVETTSCCGPIKPAVGGVDGSQDGSLAAVLFSETSKHVQQIENVPFRTEDFRRLSSGSDMDCGSITPSPRGTPEHPGIQSSAAQFLAGNAGFSEIVAGNAISNSSPTENTT